MPFRGIDIKYAFQPIVGMESWQKLMEGAEPAFHEMLIRPRDIKTGNPRNPLDFIIAKECQRAEIIRRLDSFSLRWALNKLEVDLDTDLSFNVSGKTVGSHVWHEAACSLLRRNPELAKRINVEITESAPITNRPQAISFCEAAYELGAGIWLDDCGAGNNQTPDALRGLPVTGIKIDAKLTRDYISDKEMTPFLAWIEAAQKIGAIIIAEGIETADDAHMLSGTGITHMQGYYLGRPENTPIRTPGMLVGASEPIAIHAAA